MILENQQVDGVAIKALEMDFAFRSSLENYLLDNMYSSILLIIIIKIYENRMVI